MKLRPAAFWIGCALFASPDAHAQSEPPVPDAQPPAKPPAKKKPTRKPVTPGFEEQPAEEEEKPQDAGETSSEEDPATPKKKKSRGRDTGQDEPEQDLRRPVSIPSQGTNDRLIQDMRATTGEISLTELVDEILADVVAEIDSRPAAWFSPLAIRNVQLGTNVIPSYGEELRAMITSQLHAGTEVRVIECIECDAMRTSIVNGNYVITHGLTTTEDLRRVAENIGAKAFMDVRFGFEPATGVLEMTFNVIRASDSYVLWADTFRADETTPMLMRSSDAPMKRADRLKDLEMLLEGRPYFGYVATAGFMLLPHNDPLLGDIGGATAGYRIYERFGVDRRVMFGLDLTGFLNADRLAGAVISAGSWWIPIRPDFINPELRLGTKAGAFIAGTAGNAAVFQLGAEVLLRYRFGLYAYALIMTKSEFPPNSGHELGGVGMSTGISFNW